MTNKLAFGTALIGAFALGVTAISFGKASKNDIMPSETTQENPASRATVDTHEAPHALRAVDSFTDAEADDIRTIVYEYLLDNPEILVEAFEVYEERLELAKVEHARKSLATLLKDENGHVAAANREQASVAVVELFDYHCGYCKQASGLVRDLARDDKEVVVAFREFPILRKESEFAAEAALAARAQGKYLDFHFAMMNANGTLSKQRVLDIAKKQEMDVNRLERDASSIKVRKAIQETYEIANQIGASGTPAFIVASIDGQYLKIISGYKPEAVMASVAEAKQVAAGR